MSKLNWRKRVWDDKFRTPVYCYTARAVDSLDFNITPEVWTDGRVEHWNCEIEGDVDDYNFPVKDVGGDLHEKLSVPYKDPEELKALCQAYWDAYVINFNKAIQEEAKRLHAKADKLAKRRLK